MADLFALTTALLPQSHRDTEEITEINLFAGDHHG
jgi:hypothetical protein